MALNFDKIISENENVSLEDLPIESLVQTDFDTNSNTFNKLFEDHYADLFKEDGDKNKLLTEMIDKSDLFDLDLDGLNIDDNIEKNLDNNTEPLPLCYINLTDFVYDTAEPEIYPDSDEIFSVNGSEESDTAKKNEKVIRRQSTRIQNQIRKKIAEQIQRENIRLAKEAQRLNSPDYSMKTNDIPETMMNSALGRYLALPTDLDADDDVNITDGQWKSDDDPNKLWCICKQPYGLRFMICCDSCSEWYHGDCVGVTQEEGSLMEDNGQDFICPICEKTSKKDLKVVEPVIISDDEDDDNELLIDEGDDDCRITKTVKPVSQTSNIFQIFKSSKPDSTNTQKRSNSMTLSVRTSVCLNSGCKTLVNPKKSLYCSKKCIEKYTKMVKKNNQKEKVAQYGLVKGMKLAKITRFVLAQIETETIHDEFDAPTEENLKDFLFKNRTYKVFQSTKSGTSKPLGQVRNKKVDESLTKELIAKRMKVVKHFALIFKKMVSKNVQIEFINIWQQCKKLEDALFNMCNKSINQTYISKAKELLELFKLKLETRLYLDLIQEKLSITDLLTMTKQQLDERFNTTESTELKTSFKNGSTKKPFNTNRTSISLLSDTTHLHNQHLYDINCKICNGASKTAAENKLNQEKKMEKENEIIKLKEIQKQKDMDKEKNGLAELDNIIPPTDSCSPESIVTSWFNKTSELDKSSSPSHINNDEFKVTSTVETPDMAIDMELCSTPSASEPVESSNIKITIEDKIDSSLKPEVNSSKTPTNKPTKQKLTSLWEGEITYKEVGSMFCKTYLVSRHHLGKSKEEIKEESTKELSLMLGDKLREEINLSANLGTQVKINGRTKLLVIQDYLKKLRKHSNKEFLIFRLHPTNLEEGRKTYLKMYEFFHGKDRCGVVDQKKFGLKDCYIYPLNAHSKIPSAFLPLNGPGFEKRRPHMLLMLIVRTPLEYTIYKSFSPKYDQDHDFVKNHGINLEKYYKQPQNPSVCPSPILGFVPDEKSIEVNEKLNEIIPDSKSIVCDDEDNNNNINNNNNKNPAVKEKENSIFSITEVPFDEVKTVEEVISNKSDDINISLLKQNDTPQIPDKISLHNDISPTPKDIIMEKESEKCCVVNFDQIFNPTKLDDNIIPFFSYPELFAVNSICESKDKNDEYHCNGDIDLRLLSENNMRNHQSIDNKSSVTSYSVFSISPKRKRIYTMYDAYLDDPDFRTKRAKYFFNPRIPTNTTNINRSLPF